MNAIFLFCRSRNIAEPWAEAGYDCYLVDIQHPVAYDTGGITREGRYHFVHADLTRPWLPPAGEIAFVGACPPCDHVAVSGARWFRGKGLRRLSHSIAMFATAAEFCEWSGAPYFIENPVSTIATYWRKPDYTFHPWQYADIQPADNYTKKTCLWTGGGFVMPAGLVEPVSPPDDRIHKCPPSAERANIRSEMPRGVSRAFFEANAPHLRDAA